MTCRGYNGIALILTEMHRLLRLTLLTVPQDAFQYEPLEAFGEGLTTRRPWNTGSLRFVERLNGRVAMLGFTAAVVGELTTGHGPAGQVMALVHWYLSL